MNPVKYNYVCIAEALFISSNITKLQPGEYNVEQYVACLGQCKAETVKTILLELPGNRNVT